MIYQYNASIFIKTILNPLSELWQTFLEVGTSDTGSNYANKIGSVFHFDQANIKCCKKWAAVE